MAATDLFDLAAELLTAAETAIAGSPGGPIDRAFVSPGLPSLDCCPQLTVHVGGPAEGDTTPLNTTLQPGHRTSQTALVNLVQLTITVVRCCPGPTDSHPIPSAASIQAAAEQTYADLWALWNELRAAHRAGTLFAADAGPGSRELFFDAAFPLNPQGGCAGWLVPMRVSLGGYS